MMNLTCQHCMNVSDHRLDLQSNEVVCNNCGKGVDATEIAKGILRDTKQVVKTVRSPNEVTCQACGAVAPPVIKKYSGVDYKVICKVCGEVNDYQTKFFVEALRLRPGVEIVMATPQERMEHKEKLRFNKVESSVERALNKEELESNKASKDEDDGKLVMVAPETPPPSGITESDVVESGLVSFADPVDE